MKFKYYKTIIIFWVVVLFVNCNLIAQQSQSREVDNSVTRRVSDIFTYNNQVSDFLVLQQVNNSPAILNQVTNIPLSSNVTIIQQMGVNNIVESSTISNNAMFQYVQNGDENFINSQNLINNVNENVIQNGNNNRLINFSFGSVNETNLNLIQNGNNLTFEKFGTNALTNNLQFVQQGNARTITVRSF